MTQNYISDFYYNFWVDLNYQDTIALFSNEAIIYFPEYDQIISPQLFLEGFSSIMRESQVTIREVSYDQYSLDLIYNFYDDHEFRRADHVFQFEGPYITKLTLKIGETDVESNSDSDSNSPDSDCNSIVSELELEYRTESESENTSGSDSSY